MQWSLRTVFFAALAAFVAAAFFAPPAFAENEDPATFMARVASAHAKVGSLALDVTTKRLPREILIHVVAVLPDRVSLTTQAPGVSSETRIIGDRAFIDVPGKGWRTTVSFFAIRTVVGDLIDARQRIVLLPDAVIGGTTYHRYRATPRARENADDKRPVLETTCLVDASTMLLAACDNVDRHLTFSRYDDPANVVDTPVLDPPAPAAPSPVASPQGG